MKRVRVACVLCGMVVLSCGGMTSAAAGDAGQGGGAGHADSAVPAKEGGVTDAKAKDAVTDAGSWQKWCEPGMVNDPACPAAAPTPGGFCGQNGLQCAYPMSTGVALDDCAGGSPGTALMWVSTGVLCRRNCAWVADAGTAVSVGGAACDSRTRVACDPTTYQTNQLALDSQLEALAESCGVMGVHEIWVEFSGGCATRMIGADSSAATCMLAKLAKQRYECAVGLDCGAAMFTPP